MRPTVLGTASIIAVGTAVALSFGAPPAHTTATATAAVAAAAAGPFGLDAISRESQECIDCHKKESTALYQQWGSSAHHAANVGCFECHGAEKEDPDAQRHYDQIIGVAVSPQDCARCHAPEVEQFLASRHSKAARILGSQDNVLAEVVEGNRAFKTDGFPEGNAASAVSGCWQCHGSVVKVLPGGKLDPATWPNTGVGRINPDGSEGSCTACHSRHQFSVEQARNPDNCGKCHLGPDHPQMEIYEESKHGVAFRAFKDKMHLDSSKWVVGEDYWQAPTCATCHMSATKNQPVTHDIGMRISWNNRPELSIRPEVADAAMDLPGGNVPWQMRRLNMQDVCLNCHNQVWIDNFYLQYDGLITLYNEKFARPAQALYALALPLRDTPVNFANEIDWTYYLLWHHEGRRARHGAAMMGPDYTHWHGTFEVAETFYTKFVPQLRELIEKGEASGDPDMIVAAEALQTKLDEVLRSDDHRWYMGEMDPEEAVRRQKAMEDFKARYE
jgi:hydroxylamine dehydrogenase